MTEIQMTEIRRKRIKQTKWAKVPAFDCFGHLDIRISGLFRVCGCRLEKRRISSFGFSVSRSKQHAMAEVLVKNL
jgi:hypothetical protein